VLFVNPRELTRLGFKEGDVVDVETALEYARADRVVQGLMLVSHDIPDGCCASYYPETQPLIALEYHDPQSLTPSYKSVPVRIRAAGRANGSDTAVARDGVVGVAAA
jgi:anaerobic selenocysteine-containing dehydrogenase